MKRALLIALAVIVVAGAFGLVAVGGYLGNMFGGAEHPPCETLPSPEQVRRALDQHTELTGKLTAVGEGVRVGVDTPCDDKQAALVEVQVRSEDEQSRVDDVLGTNKGFGVPVTVVRE